MLQNAKCIEFERLRQVEMTIMEYEASFTNLVEYNASFTYLVKYALHLDATDEMRAWSFEDRL